MYCFSNKLLKGIVCLVVLSLAQNSYSQPNGEMAPTQWREDLAHLQRVVHQKYSNLFYNVTAKQFDSAIAAVEKKIGTMGDLQMRVEIAKIVAMFQVGHTMVTRNIGSGNGPAWLHGVPVGLYMFSDGLYIKNIDEKYKQAAGGKVIKIGNTPVEKAFELIRPVISYENEQGFKNMLQYYLNQTEYLHAVGIIDDTRKVPITYEKDGKQETIELIPPASVQQAAHANFSEQAGRIDAYRGNNTPLWLKNADRLRYFEYLPASKTVYVRHSGVQNERDETIADFFARVFDFVDKNDVEKFILDIRMNGGGNNYLNKPVITGLIQSKKINQKGKLFVITGKATFSAAQNLTNEIEKYTEVTFVGEPTSENVNFYGDTKTEVLPNSGLNVNLSWLWWQNHDPRDKRKWTAPQLAVDMSFEDYKNGRDPAMDVILQYKPTQSIENELSHLISTGNKEQALTAAKKYLKDPLYRYYSTELENKINNTGYTLLGQNKMKEANEMFWLNVELFPNSANVYDSYAESFWKSGNKPEAVKYYKIAIDKDPNGPTGENARNMLKQIDDKKGF